MNYNKLMEEELVKIKELGIRPKLLLHCCCGPCSSACVERLIDVFDVTLYFYNPNITLVDEYNKRLVSLLDFINKYNDKINVIKGVYEPDKFLSLVSDYKDEAEGGRRCYLCYEDRISNTYKYACENGFDYFTTTLSISPHKNSNWINEIGKQLTGNSKYLYADFKKREGYKRSLELSKKYEMYRQDYCGCPYSVKTDNV